MQGLLERDVEAAVELTGPAKQVDGYYAGEGPENYVVTEQTMLVRVANCSAMRSSEGCHAYTRVEPLRARGGRDKLVLTLSTNLSVLASFPGRDPLLRAGSAVASPGT